MEKNVKLFYDQCQLVSDGSLELLEFELNNGRIFKVHKGNVDYLKYACQICRDMRDMWFIYKGKYLFKGEQYFAKEDLKNPLMDTSYFKEVEHFTTEEGRRAYNETKLEMLNMDSLNNKNLN